MQNDTVITDQRAPIRPIAFVLDNMGEIQDPVILPIRPEDLNRVEPSRVSVHQTLGRYVSGWADDFGAGLPTCTISGHTGWGAGGRPDGWNSFEELNNLVTREFHAAKQEAINNGDDPALVKLLFVDMLDDFAWNVKPTQFILRRSKSRPLFFQYNITLQAVSTDVDNPIVFEPDYGNESNGLDSLDNATTEIEEQPIDDMINGATGLAALAAAVRNLVDKVAQVFRIVAGYISAARGIASGVLNTLIDIARNLALVGSYVFRTIAAIRNLPATLKAELLKVSSAFNEVNCIFANSLRPKKVYEVYTGLYGASNCSSTTGGLPPSLYATQNVFDLLKKDKTPITVSSLSLSSIATIKQSDPVLAPMPLPELNRHVGIIASGISV